ncbi:MAG: urea ABC transporter permease subunit UrtC [Verrucomicrobiaceae bacterium]|nr:MAG: urea ABC transporter permease subunit UrtC [Verrucomicrobiaceae bacterium]
MNKQPLTSRVQTPLLIVSAIFLVIVMPVLNAYGVISDFRLENWGKYLCYGILAISIDLLWGYTGLLCLGQALFFTLGGYMMGMHLMRVVGGDGVPTFLSMVGRTEWPSFFLPFSSFPFALVMIMLVPGVLAGIFGFLAFRSRIKGVYFSILTQALTYGAALLFFRNELLMGGNNGFTDFRTLLGFSLRDVSTKRGLYIATAILLVLVVMGCKWLTNSRFGLIQRAIRDSENRVLFSGYATANYKLFIFVISAIIAAFAGALFVPQAGIINPSEMTTEKSLEAVVWVALGGRGTIVGPVLGAISVNALKSWASQEFPDFWLLLLGGSFVLIVLFMPKGLVGLPSQIQGFITRLRRKNEASDSPPPSDKAKIATDP